jgi:hypothetical protein
MSDRSPFLRASDLLAWYLLDRLANDDISARRPVNEVSGPEIDEWPILIGHCRTPLQLSQSIVVVDRQRRGDGGGDIGAAVVDWPDLEFCLSVASSQPIPPPEQQEA